MDRAKAVQNRKRALQLNADWGVGAVQCRFSHDGRWYATLSQFPAALFDSSGYVLFENDEEYRAYPYININKQIGVPAPGISATPSYVRVVEAVTNLVKLPVFTSLNEETSESVAKDHFDWQAEVSGWCQQRRNISPAMTSAIITFFRLAFQNTQCPEKAWFGCHTTSISLVIGGIYIAAIPRTGHDRGLWLITDKNAPQINGIDYIPIKSASNSQSPLLWAHSASLQVIPDLVACRPLWDSFSSATELILTSSRSVGDRDAVQIGRNKRRLSEFWTANEPTLTSEKAGPSNLSQENRDRSMDIADVAHTRLTEQRTPLQWSQRPTIAQYVAGLKAIESRMNDIQRRLLIAQYSAPQRTAYSTQLARLANVNGPSVVNSNYGKLGHMFCDATGIEPDIRKSGTRRWWTVWSLGHASRRGTIWKMLPEVATALEQLGWVSPLEFFSPDEVPSSVSLAEGTVRQITVNAYERNEQARRHCVEHYGTHCFVCGFHFGEQYGEVGNGFIHVHHLRQLADIRAEYEVDPIADLRPVCPNCHTVIHRRNPPYSIEEVKGMLRVKA